MGIASGVTHFFESILEVFQGILGAIVHFFQLVLNTIIAAFQGLVHFVEGTLGFAFRKFSLPPKPQGSFPFSNPHSSCLSAARAWPPLSIANAEGPITNGARQRDHADNFFLIGTVVAVWFGYMLYTQRQGTAPASRAVKGRY